MEMIVVYNQGMQAAKDGLERAVPDAIDYPIVSQYVAYRTEKANLDRYSKREWLRGYDAFKAA